MAAMKPRTGDGPLEVTKEGRGIVLRMPLEGGGRLVVEMTPDEVRALGEAIDNCEGLLTAPEQSRRGPRREVGASSRPPAPPRGIVGRVAGCPMTTSS